jgi:hypothetical protein
MPESIDHEDIDNAMALIQSPSEAWKVSKLITERLCGIREVAVLPPGLYREIAEIVAEFYALGYVKGMRNRP